MVTQPMRISKTVFDQIRGIAEEKGNPSDDTTLRLIIEDREKYQLKIKILEKELEESNEIIKSYLLDLKDSLVTINQKNERIKELEWKLGKYEADGEI